MKIEQSTVTKLRISGADNLDPITVVLDDIAPGKGKIFVECYGQAWSAYWGGMGDRSLAEFFSTRYSDSVAGHFGLTQTRVTDYDAVSKAVCRYVLKMRRDKTIDDIEARELYDDALLIQDEESFTSKETLVKEVYQDECYPTNLPTTRCPEHRYVCRIIEAVQAALKEHARKQAA